MKRILQLADFCPVGADRDRFVRSKPETELSVNPETGLLAEEQRIADAISTIWGDWCKLPKQHPDDSREVCDAVHVIQGLLMQRVTRRAFPVGWPIKQ